MLKKILILCALLSPFAAWSQPYQAVTGFCWNGAKQAVTSGLNSSNYLQGVIPYCTVTVYATETTNESTLYTTATGGSLTNGFQANADGSWIFYIATGQGNIDITLSGGFPPNTYSAPRTITDVNPGAIGVGAANDVAGYLTSTTVEPVPGLTFAVNCYDSYANLTVQNVVLCSQESESTQDTYNATTTKGAEQTAYQSLSGGYYNVYGSNGVKSNRGIEYYSGSYNTVAQNWGQYLSLYYYSGGEGIPITIGEHMFGGYVSHGQEANEGFREQLEQGSGILTTEGDGVGGIWTATQNGAPASSVVSFSNGTPWNSGTTYTYGNLASYNGYNWFAVAPVTGTAPSQGPWNNLGTTLAEQRFIRDVSNPVANPSQPGTYGGYSYVSCTSTASPPVKCFIWWGGGAQFTANWSAVNSTITIVTNPANGVTLTINGTVVTFVTSGASGNQVNIGANATATATALYTLLSTSADSNLVKSTYTNPSAGEVILAPVTPGFVQTLATNTSADFSLVGPGGVTSLTLVQGGSLYGSTNVPVILFIGNCNTYPSATAVVSGGAVTGYTSLTPGSCLSLPAVYVIGGGGTVSGGSPWNSLSPSGTSPYTSWDNIASGGQILTNSLTFCINSINGTYNHGQGYSFTYPFVGPSNGVPGTTGDPDICVPVTTINTSGTTPSPVGGQTLNLNGTITTNLYALGTEEDSDWQWVNYGQYGIYNSAWPGRVNALGDTFTACNTSEAGVLTCDSSGLASSAGHTLDQVIAYNGDQEGIQIYLSKLIGRVYGGGINIIDWGPSSAPAFAHGLAISGNFEDAILIAPSNATNGYQPLSFYSSDSDPNNNNTGVSGAFLNAHNNPGTASQNDLFDWWGFGGKNSNSSPNRLFYIRGNPDTYYFGGLGVAANAGLANVAIGQTPVTNTVLYVPVNGTGTYTGVLGTWSYASGGSGCTASSTQNVTFPSPTLGTNATGTILINGSGVPTGTVTITNPGSGYLQSNLPFTTATISSCTGSANITLSGGSAGNPINGEVIQTVTEYTSAQNGSEPFEIKNAAGSLEFAVQATSSPGSYNTIVAGTLILQNSLNAAAPFGSTITPYTFTPTFTSSGTSQLVRALEILPTYNQTSATSVQNSDLLIKRTETSLGTSAGAQYLIQAQTGATNEFLVDHAGNVTANGTISGGSYGTASQCTSSASPAVCGSAAAGFVNVAVSSTTVVVDTTAVTANSTINVVFDSSLGTALGVTCNTTVNQPTVSARIAGTSFTITMASSVSTHPDCLSYSITN